MAKDITISALKKMANEYGVAENPLFIAAAEQYITQQKMISAIRKELDAADLAVSKQYVKGRENVYAHPLIKELTKHSDSANKTLETILKVITTLGKKQESTVDEFEAFIDGRDKSD